MAKRMQTRSEDDHDVDQQPPIRAREAFRVVQLARRYITEITDRQPVQITAVTHTDEHGWIAEVEVVEDRRIPPSSDILALYAVELDADGELLAYRRTCRYKRGQVRSPMRDAQKTGELVADGQVLAAEQPALRPDTT